jgi:hypothetical protein
MYSATMPTVTMRSLGVANQYLRARLDRLRGGPDRPATISPTEFTDLLQELRSAAEHLRGLPPAIAGSADTAADIAEYRKNLEQLERILPWVQGRLLIEKARLQTLQSHMAAARAWAEASRTTL